MKAKATIVEAVTVMKAGLTLHDALTDSFDLAMDCIRDFYRAYRWYDRVPVLAPDRDAIAPFILWATRDMDSSSYDEGWALFQVNRGPLHLADQEILDEDQRSGVADSMHLLMAGHPAPAVVESRLEARAAARAGDYSTAVVKAATAAETLLDAALTLMLWEEGAVADECAKNIKPYFKSRLKSHFHARLGGDWSMTQPGHPLTQWLQDAAQLRHRVVHRGYRPTAHECEKSLESLDAVQDFLSDALASHFSQYFRTCVAILGTSNLSERGLLTDQHRNRLSDEGYVWVDSYQDWLDRFYAIRYAGE
jgi:hypothetical protein